MNDISSEKMTALAKKILSSQIKMIEGCHAMASLLFGLPLQLEDDFIIFTAVASDTDHLPLGEERKNWDKKVLIEKDTEILETENFYRDAVFEGCRKIIKRFDKNLI